MVMVMVIFIIVADHHHCLCILISAGLHVTEGAKVLELFRIIHLLELGRTASSLAQPREEFLHEEDEHEPAQREKIDERKALHREDKITNKIEHAQTPEGKNCGPKRMAAMQGRRVRLCLF
jgi:hypothetical protein